MHYFKKNIGDYAKKTGRLSMLQHGGYTLLIDSCYDRERFPTLEDAIEWSWASSKEEIEAVEFVLRRFFVLEDGVYVQSRIREEIAEYHAKASTNKRIADEREAKRKGKDTTGTRTVHDSLPSVNEAPPNHKPINQEPSITVSKDTVRPPTGEPEEKPQVKLPGCDHKGILALYHETLPNLPTVEIWNDTRAGYLRQRWREVALDLSKDGAVTHADMLAWWKKFFEHIGSSKFLTGKKQQKDKPSFLADLEWVIKPMNFTKIIEGKYHRE